MDLGGQWRLFVSLAAVLSWIEGFRPKNDSMKFNRSTRACTGIDEHKQVSLLGTGVLNGFVTVV